MKAKTIIAVTLSVCLVCTGGGYGIYYYIQNSKTPVEVMPVSYLSTQYYGGSSSISGTASSDVSQQVQLTGENSVKEVYVEAGDQVHVGDKLMAYDMTLTELDLEMERLNKATLGLRLESAQEELDKLYSTTPVERSDTALVVSNDSAVSMAAGDETAAEQADSEAQSATPDPQTEIPTEAPVETEAQTEAGRDAADARESSAGFRTDGGRDAAGYSPKPSGGDARQRRRAASAGRGCRRQDRQRQRLRRCRRRRRNLRCRDMVRIRLCRSIRWTMIQRQTTEKEQKKNHLSFTARKMR